MPSPVTSANFAAAEPLSNANACERLTAFFGIPTLLKTFFAWMTTSTGALSDEFKAEVATYSAPTGMLAYFASQNVGSGWLLCDAREVSRADYPALFQQIGTLYGAGDTTTTFNLPDGRGRSLIGAGTGTGLSNRDISTKYVGAETHTLTIAEIPAHTHEVVSTAAGRIDGGDGGHILNEPEGDNPPESPAHTTESTGGGAAHNIISPMLIGWLHVKT